MIYAKLPQGDDQAAWPVPLGKAMSRRSNRELRSQEPTLKTHDAHTSSPLPLSNTIPTHPRRRTTKRILPRGVVFKSKLGLVALEDLMKPVNHV